MKALGDPDRLLSEGLARIRERFAVPAEFPPEVLAEAEQTRDRQPAEHADWTDRAFVTLDPASSTDLDQAFVIEQAGADLLLHYALADIGWFVPPGGAMEAEAWKRGVTLYLPDGKARLYPGVLSENVASLLPDGPRPAIVASVRCAQDGSVSLDGVQRAIVLSRAKLAYETVDMAAVPHLKAFAARMTQAENARGATRIDPPEQELERDDSGHYTLSLRAQLPSERANATLSLACNIAIAKALHAAKTGMFREMPAPDERAVHRLRQAAKGLGLAWPEHASLKDFERTVDPRTASGASFQLAIRRAGGGADYVPFAEGRMPWHDALSSIYTHATAPMRRLADRLILETALALAKGAPVASPEDFAAMCEAMNRADQREGAIERAVMDLAEAAILSGREGEVFRATVLERDDRGARIQLADAPVVARVDTQGVGSGEEMFVRLLRVDVEGGELAFKRVR